MDRHADRPRLVSERPGDGLADPPGGVGGELVAAAPVEFLDGADQPERAFLDQVEEGEALVAVVLRDRDDEAEVGLDHPLLRGVVAALDQLRERDLLGAVSSACFPASRRKSCSASVVVSADCAGGGGGGDGSCGSSSSDVDAALLAFAVEGLGFELVHLVRLDELGELGRPSIDRPARPFRLVRVRPPP